MTKIDFQIETKYGLFSDALHLEDNHGLTEEQIEALKQQRADNWVSHIDSASAAVTDEPVENGVSSTEETPAE